jgi:hypothetical protein
MNTKISFLWKDTNVWYATTCYWWYSLRVVDEVRCQKLESWLSFWHFRVRQWGGFMTHV